MLRCSKVKSRASSSARSLPLAIGLSVQVAKRPQAEMDRLIRQDSIRIYTNDLHLTLLCYCHLHAPALGSSIITCWPISRSLTAAPDKAREEMQDDETSPVTVMSAGGLRCLLLIYSGPMLSS